MNIEKKKNTSLRRKKNTAPKPVESFPEKENGIIIKGNIDYPFLVLVLIMVCFGLVMVFSASYAYALSEKENSMHFFLKQGGFDLAGIVFMLVVTLFIPYKMMRKFTNIAYVSVLVLLALTLVYGLAAGVTRRWIPVPVLGTFQPSEAAKLAMCLILAKYFSDNNVKMFNYRKKYSPFVNGIVIPFVWILPMLILIALEPHFSCLIIMVLMFIVIIYCAGCDWKWILGGGLGLAGVGYLIISFVPYAIKRIDVFRHPENYSALSDTWQTLQGLNAIGSGGLFGVGLGQSVQKHMFVSQPQNDFIFTIICEELGLVGALAVIVLFILLIYRGFVIAKKAPDIYSKLTVVGIISHIGIQATLNMLVVTNIIPNTGISLPFFSYGGSSTLLQLVEMGIVLSISRYSYQRKPEDNG